MLLWLKWGQILRWAKQVTSLSKAGKVGLRQIAEFMPYIKEVSIHKFNWLLLWGLTGQKFRTSICFLGDSTSTRISTDCPSVDNQIFFFNVNFPKHIYGLYFDLWNPVWKPQCKICVPVKFDWIRKLSSWPIGQLDLSRRFMNYWRTGSWKCNTHWWINPLILTVNVLLGGGVQWEEVSHWRNAFRGLCSASWLLGNKENFCPITAFYHDALPHLRLIPIESASHGL